MQISRRCERKERGGGKQIPLRPNRHKSRHMCHLINCTTINALEDMVVACFFTAGRHHTHRLNGASGVILTAYLLRVIAIFLLIFSIY